jgi:hypothetical protein
MNAKVVGKIAMKRKAKLQTSEEFSAAGSTGLCVVSPRPPARPHACTAPHLRLEKRQGGRRKTLTYPAGALISMFSQFPKRGRLPPLREFVQIIPFMASLVCSEAVRRFEPMNGPDPHNERGDRFADLNL